MPFHNESQSVLVNEPLDFEIKDLDVRSPYLQDCGFTPATLRHFGVGYCTRGLMAGRHVIPVHNVQSRLVGYVGLQENDRNRPADEPRYRFPPVREQSGVTHEFNKSRLVYNAHRIQEPKTGLVLVQDFRSAWWLWQSGYNDVVALMDTSCSPDQARIIVEKVTNDGIVLLVTLDDETGRTCAASVVATVGRSRAMRWVAHHFSTPPIGQDLELLPKLLWDY